MKKKLSPLTIHKVKKMAYQEMFDRMLTAMYEADRPIIQRIIKQYGVKCSDAWLTSKTEV